MIVVFDARGIRTGMTGVGRYAACLADALCRLRPHDEFVFLGLRGQDPALRPPVTRAAANARWIEVAADPESHPAGGWWMHMRLPRLLDELRADVFHGPAFVVPFGWHRPRCARVVTLHDLCAFRMPHATPWRFGLYLRWAAARSVAASDRVICPTKSTCDAARRQFAAEPPAKFVAVAEAPVLALGAAGPGLRMDGMDDVDMVEGMNQVGRRGQAGRASPPPGGNQTTGNVFQKCGPAALGCESIQAEPAGSRPFLMMVGTFETRKNPLFLLRFYEALRRRLLPDTSPAGTHKEPDLRCGKPHPTEFVALSRRARLAAPNPPPDIWGSLAPATQPPDSLAESRVTPPLPPIVWVGRRGHGAARLLDAMQPLRAAGLFRLEETTDDAALAALYRSATALVYPSLDEGFGLPLVEAMAAGLPVLAADASCLPEVVETGGLCLPLDAPDAWAEAVAALLTDPRRRADAAARARSRARDFSWEIAARLTFQTYEAAVAARRARK